MALDISVNPYGALNIMDENSHRWSLVPGADLTNQPEEVVAKAAEIWTPEILEAYQKLIGEVIWHS
jgi:hypothetical protein